MKPQHSPRVSLKEAGGQARRERTDPERGRRNSETGRRLWLWLVAVLLVVVFLAGECAVLLPAE